MVYKILIVCHANKGRSQGLCACLEYLSRLEDRDDLIFESAGIGEEEIRELRRLGKSKTSATMARILRERGIRIEEQEIRHISEVEGDFNLILGVGREEKDYVRKMQSEAEVYTVKEFAGEPEGGDMFDAYQFIKKIGKTKDDPEYEFSHRIMCWGLQRLAEKVYDNIKGEAAKHL